MVQYPKTNSSLNVEVNGPQQTVILLRSSHVNEKQEAMVTM